MFGKKIILVLVFLAILTISAVSATSENAENSTDIAYNVTEVDNTLYVEKTDFSAIAKSDLTKNSSDEIKSITMAPSKLTTTYSSGKYFKVKVKDSKTKNPLSNVKLILKVYSGNKFKKISITSDSNGIAKYSASLLGVGSHKVIVNVQDSKHFISKEKSSLIKIIKAKLSISAPKFTSYYNKNKKYKITVKNKESKKPMKNIKVVVKVFTGKKYNKYSLKTDKNGIVSFNTKSLSKAKHNVVVNIKSTPKINSVFSKTYIKIIAHSRMIKLKINNHILNVKLEDNSAVKALIDKLKMGDITIHAEDYGNFEKVGDLGFSLPRSDKYMTTSLGDIVLYNGNEISLFYNSNSWSYTKLGKVQNTKDLKDILGNGDVTLVLSLK